MKRVLGGPLLALAFVVLGSAVGCGSSVGGPQTYTLDRDSNRVAVGALAPIGPFSIPSGAIISYSIVDNPVGIGDDNMTFAIDPGGYAAYSGSSISTSTGPLPGGSYYLDITCDNLIDDCFFDDEVTATY